MDKLISYLNSLTTEEQADFARRCGTTVGYLRKAASAKQQLGESLCINIDRESGRAVTLDYLRGDADWNYVRSTANIEPVA